MDASKKYLRAIGETVLDRLLILHSTYDDTGMIRDTMIALFGEPRFCLICAESLRGKSKYIPNDVDPWFCSRHCPVCSDGEKLDI